jgi:hypothetical protein
MDEDSRSFAAECNAPKLATTGGGDTVEILLRYASFATAGLPNEEIDNVVAILARQRNHAETVADDR